MTDLDFDELDRAVNSVIGKDTTTASVPVSSTPRSAPAATTPARPSTGRFMDVVHPSSDMRGSSTPASLPEAPSIVTQALGAEVASDTPASPAWPDPIDFHNSTVSPTVTDEPTPGSVDDIPAETSGSPFLSGTQVAKRPLGAFSSTIEEPATPTDTPVDQDTNSSKDSPIENDVPLPAELQDDLLSIESATALPESIPELPDEPPAGPVSITPQYKEQAPVENQPSGSIFDTESYHPPLAHPAKKKSGLWVILWIFLLIAVGAGAGAAVYFFVLPLL